jgi:uncharacterized membrane protein YphA (DoxX/SURF4 family)
MNPLVRLLIALLVSPFVISGVSKLLNFSGAQAEVVALSGLQPAALWAGLVIATQLGGSLLLVAGRGRWAWLGALLLAGFTALATLLGHAWWTKEGMDRVRDFNVFWEHVALAGGLLLGGWVLGRREEGAAA